MIYFWKNKQPFRCPISVILKQGRCENQLLFILLIFLAQELVTPGYLAFDTRYPTKSGSGISIYKFTTKSPLQSVKSMSGVVQIYSTVGVRVPICRRSTLLKICAASFLPSKSMRWRLRSSINSTPELYISCIRTSYVIKLKLSTYISVSRAGADFSFGSGEILDKKRYWGPDTSYIWG